jgi:broad specificity phosphatase PhoE
LTIYSFRKRIAAWFTGFLASHRDTDSDGSICIVSHGAYITTFVALLLSSHYFRFERGDNVDMRAGCHNTSIMKVECRYQPDRGRWEGKVLSFGDVDHIAKEARSHGHASRLADDLKG